MSNHGGSAALLSSSPDHDKFKGVKSVEARKLLDALLEWGGKYSALFGHQPRVLMQQFGERYKQILFEEAVQCWNVDDYLRIVRGKNFKAKTQEDVLKAMSLEFLFDMNWNHGEEVKQATTRAGHIKDHEELYTWLVTNYLTNSFSKFDLNKIVEMAGLAQLNIIKTKAMQILDLFPPQADGLDNKNTISYLHGAITKINESNQTISRRNNAINTVNDRRLAELKALGEAGPDKIPMKPDPDRIARWERERAFADVLRDLDE